MGGAAEGGAAVGGATVVGGDAGGVVLGGGAVGGGADVLGGDAGGAVLGGGAVIGGDADGAATSSGTTARGASVTSGASARHDATARAAAELSMGTRIHSALRGREDHPRWDERGSRGSRGDEGQHVASQPPSNDGQARSERGGPERRPVRMQDDSGAAEGDRAALLRDGAGHQRREHQQLALGHLVVGVELEHGLVAGAGAGEVALGDRLAGLDHAQEHAHARLGRSL